MTVQDTITQAARSLRTKFDTSDYSLATVFDLAVLVAAADGVVDDAEMTALGATVRDILGLEMTEEDLHAMVRGGIDLMNALGHEVRGKLISQILKERNAAEEAVQVAAAVGYASEGLAASERKIIEDIGLDAGLTLERIGVLLGEAGVGAETSEPERPTGPPTPEGNPEGNPEVW